MANKYAIGILILVLLTSSIYIMMPNNLRIDVGKTYSTFKVWENDSWILSGTERTILFDGTKKMRASSRNIESFVNGNITTIIRTANFKDNITAIDTYLFDGNEKDIELFPISHKINVLNGEGKILVYEVTNLLYDGETVKDILSPQSFGHNMKIEWADGNYYSRIWGYADRDEGKLTIKYRPDSSNFTKEVRLFDPIVNYTIEGDKVFIDDALVYIEAYPHTVRGSDWVTFNFTSKVYSGDVDLVLGFDTESLQAQGVRRYDPTNESRERSYTCNDEFIYTINPKHFWCYKNNSIIDNQTNETFYSTQIIFEHDFDYGNLNEKIAYWTEDYIDKYKIVSNSIFNSVDYDYQGMNKWYYYKNLAITQGDPFAFQVKINNLDLWGEGKKYNFGIKPSHLTIQEAILQDKFYLLDPWTEGLNNSGISYYRLDESSGNAEDAFENFTMTATGITYGTAGIINDAFDFEFGDTSDRLFNAAHIDPDSYNSGLSINVWIKPETFPAVQGYMFIWPEVGSWGTVELRLLANQNFTFRFGCGNSGCYHQNLGTISLDTWSMLTITHNTTTDRFYIDGNLIGSFASGTMTNNGNDLYIGNGPADNFPYDGLIDEVFITGKSLTPSEIDALWNDGDGLPFGPPIDADSCTYSSGNWEIECSDGCNISSNVDVSGNNVSVNGTGYLHLTANVTNFLKLSAHGTDSSNICRINCNGGCFR